MAQNKVCVEAYVISTWIDLICDMGWTPHIALQPSRSDREMSIPMDRVNEQGFLVLEVSGSSIKSYFLDKQEGYISFGATFRGVHKNIKIPIETIIDIYGKETGIGAHSCNFSLQNDLGLTFLSLKGVSVLQSAFFKNEIKKTYGPDAVVEIKSQNGKTLDVDVASEESKDIVQLTEQKEPVKRGHLTVIK